MWFYKAEGDSNAYVVTADGKLSTNGALNIYSKEINTENKEGYSAEQIKEYADIAYSITEEADRYDAYEIQVLHKDTGEWETIDNLDTYNIQDGDDIRYHVTAEAAHKLTYVSGDHSHGEQFLDGYYYKGESAAVKSFNDTGLAADTGYKFDHWENAAGETVSGSYTMGDKDTELKAVCVKDDLSVHELKYTVEYYKDGVIVTGDTKEIKRNVWINDNEIPVLPNDIDTSDGKYPGYHFTGTDPKEIGETVKNGATVKVYYAANTDTAYTVQRFYETDGSYKAEPDEILPGEGTTGQLADTIEYRSTDRPGYVYDKDAPGTIESGVIQGDGSLVLKVYFKQQFSVTYKPGTHGTFDDKTFSGLGYNADTPAFTAEGEAGYEFAGWAPDYSDKVTSSVEYVAQWKAADNTKYTVEYYYQNEGTYPETTENRRDAYGTTGDTAKLTADDTQTARAGYVYDSEYEGNVTEGTINGDGSLVLKVYFKQQFSVVYKPGTQGTFPERVYDDLDYGVKTPAFGAQPTGNPGYTFAGWGEVAENVTDNAQYTAQWTANTNTAYTVEHYQEQLNGSYTETETENLTGTTGATATATRKTYTGFTFNPEVAGTIESGTITGDGKLVLKLFYSRDEHTVTYMVDGQQYGETDTYKYGQNTAPLREQPVKEGYTFNGWNGQLPEVMGTEDVVISGSFTINSYNVTYELDGQPYGETERYEFGSDVSVRPAPEVPAGYHFGGWSQKEDFKM
ncbi:InlB B-repeat-containing protein, partial [[Clostridium] hylemonae]|uniref:InlB B-repeat-containing protein n=1 Tax=[Clostridium] hylemonae TaxID=89153 RepID=UPI003994CFFF